MSDMLKRLIEQRARVWEQAKAHLDAVEKEGREFTGEADETWGRYNGELSALDQRINEVSSLEDRNAKADEVRARFEGKTTAPEVAAVQSDNDILRSIVAGERRSFEFRDLTKGTSTAGGHTVPTGFYGQLQEHLIENSAIRQTNVTVLTTDSGQDLQIPKTTTHPTAAIIAEAAAITESDPVFGQVTLNAFKYAYSTQISSELEQDTGVDLMGYLASRGGVALGNGSGAHFVTGTGSSQPNGIVTASTAGKTGATGQTTSVTYDDLVDLQHSVIAPYRQRGTWMFNDGTLAKLRKLKDADNRPLWQPGLVGGEPNVLLGNPYVVDTNVASMAASAKSILFGDFSTYFIRDVRGVRVERSVDFAFSTDLVTWRFLFRTDGDQIDTTGAVKHYANSAT